MATPGSIATQMYMAMRDIESALQQLASALNLPAYEAPAGKYRDRAYADMVRMRSLATYLTGAVERLEQLPAQLGEALEDTAGALDAAEAASAQASALRATLEQALPLLTKAQLIELGGGLGIEGLSDSQRKEDLIATLIAAAMAIEQGAIWRTPEEFAAMQRVDASDADESDSPDSDEPAPPAPDASDNGYQMESND